MTPLLHEDPTLPRISNVPCPNATCDRPADRPNEVLYVKYDAKQLRFLYSCAYCKHMWT
jgi:aspartate carbamoyltransferase regulatory subunit